MLTFGSRHVEIAKEIAKKYTTDAKAPMQLRRHVSFVSGKSLKPLRVPTYVPRSAAAQ